MKFLNLQNKIHGRGFCNVFVNYDIYDGQGKYALTPPESKRALDWHLNFSTIEEFGIPMDFFEDFISQLEDLGDIHSLRMHLGMQPGSGERELGLTLRHKEYPQIIASVKIHDQRDREVGYNPNIYNYPADITLRCFVDVSHLGPDEYNNEEEEMKVMDVLSLGGMYDFGDAHDYSDVNIHEEE